MTLNRLDFANSLIEKEQYEQADALCLSEIANSPESPFFYAAYGNSLFGQKKYDKAIEQYRLALKISPEEPSALMNLAGALYETQDFQECLDICNRLLNNNPENVTAFIHKGNALSASGKYDDALKAYESALSLTPQNTLVLFNLSTVFLKQEKYGEAIAVLEPLLEKYPENEEYLSALIMAFEGAEEFFKAGKKQLELLKRKPEPLSHITMGGIVYALKTRQEEEHAFILLDEWLALFPGNAVAEHSLKTLSGEDEGARASSEYVTELFDVFADSFDDVLAKLEYKAPELIAKHVLETIKTAENLLDLGCGTGLCLKALKKQGLDFQRAVGVDLSEKMIEKAEKSSLYTQLICKDILTYLPQASLKFDLIISGDVFTYLGDLRPLMHGIKLVLKKNGRAVFTLTENEINEKDFFLTPSGRYVHSQQYLHRLIKENDFKISSFQKVVLRQEMGVPVNGFLLEICFLKPEN